MDIFPEFLYHKDQAPDGRLFQTQAELDEFFADLSKAEQAQWVDTPAKFDPKYKEPPVLASADEVGEDAAAAGYVPEPFPMHVYQKGDVDSARLIQTQEELDALEAAEPGVWKDTYDPKAWDKKAKKAAAAPPAATAAAMPASAPDAPAAPLSDEQKAAFHKAPIAKVIEQLDAVSTVPGVEALMAAEAENPKKRPSVQKALKARLAILKAGAE